MCVKHELKRNLSYDKKNKNKPSEYQTLNEEIVSKDLK